MADYGAIADALAARFLGTTPPTGQPAIRLATADLPNDITVVPAFLVFEPDDEWSLQGMSGRRGVLTFTCHLVLAHADEPRTARAVMDWRTALYSRLDGQVTLGLTGVVAIVKSTGLRRLPYGVAEYTSVMVTVEVTVSEAASFEA